jgi:hypothetical protein
MFPDGGVGTCRHNRMMSKTRDHTVPIMYLKRWGALQRQTHTICAAPVSNLAKSFQTSVKNVAVEGDFYRGTTPDGVEHHVMENLLSQIEEQATPAFRKLLDAGRLPSDSAYPLKWPPLRSHRRAISRWIAAQILRTHRQRRRLWKQLGADASSEHHVNQHLAYMNALIEPLAEVIARRPWGFGFSSACLTTSDTPVVILNGLDADQQLMAAAYWDIYVPLDPHRLLFIPSPALNDDPHVRFDHFFTLDGGLGLAMNSAMLDAAVKHVFWHEQHDRITVPGDSRGQRPTGFPTQVTVSYRVLRPGFAVERRWLENHSSGTEPENRGSNTSEATPEDHLEELFQRLQNAEAGWKKLTGES